MEDKKPSDLSIRFIREFDIEKDKQPVRVDFEFDDEGNLVPRRSSLIVLKDAK